MVTPLTFGGAGTGLLALVVAAVVAAVAAAVALALVGLVVASRRRNQALSLRRLQQGRLVMMLCSWARPVCLLNHEDVYVGVDVETVELAHLGVDVEAVALGADSVISQRRQSPTTCPVPPLLVSLSGAWSQSGAMRPRMALNLSNVLIVLC
jgi:hypothetical protein